MVIVILLGGGGSGNCKDVYPQYCPGYKQNGICTDPNYLDYVKEVCKFTCGFCSKYYLASSSADILVHVCYLISCLFTFYFSVSG